MYRFFRWVNTVILGILVMKVGDWSNVRWLLNIVIGMLLVYGIAETFRDRRGYMIGEDEKKLKEKALRLLGVESSWRVKGQGKIEVVSLGYLTSEVVFVVGENYLDTLLKMEDSEFKSILLHELGHQRLGHLAFYWEKMLVDVGLLSLIMTKILGSWLVIVVFVAIVGLGYPGEGLQGLVWLSKVGIGIPVERMKEYEADDYAKEKGLGKELVKVLEHFPKQIHSAVEYVPSLEKRLKKLKAT